MLGAGVWGPLSSRGPVPPGKDATPPLPGLP